MNEGGPRTFESVRRGKVRGGRVQLSAGALWEGSETSGSSLGNPACVLRVASPHRAGLCGGDAPAVSGSFVYAGATPGWEAGLSPARGAL